MRASFDSKSTETEYVTKLQKSYSLVQEEHLMGDDKNMMIFGWKLSLILEFIFSSLFLHFFFIFLFDEITLDCNEISIKIVKHSTLIAHHMHISIF